MSLADSVLAALSGIVAAGIVGIALWRCPPPARRWLIGAAIVAAAVILVIVLLSADPDETARL